MIAVLDRSGCVEIWNTKAEQFSGIPAADACGVQAAGLLPQFSQYLELVPDVIDRKRPSSFERIQLAAGSDRRFFSMQIVPLASGDADRAVVRIDDISAQIRIEEVMMQTEKMMVVGSLAAGMAHEINNPLGAIMQHAQNIERRVSPDIAANHAAAAELGISLDAVRSYLGRRGILDFISHIREGGARTARIIDSMLRFSRSGGSQRDSADLAAVIDQTLELAGNDYDLKKRYGFRQIAIVRDYADDMPRVPIVTLEIEQVLLNIIRNAAQAMASASHRLPPRLTVRLRSEGTHARIEIEDNGPGMTETVRRRVFEPFYTTREVGVGTGLGLSVSYSIITANHQGSIEARSREGEGACFIIKLPLRGREQ